MRADRRSAAGFTLIELVIVMIVIAVGLLGLTGLFSNTSTSLSTNETLQQAAQYAQKCAERAIATRRALGFDWFAANTFTCESATGFTFSGGTLLVGDIYPGNGNPCPSGTNCRDINVKVSSAADPAIYSAITVMLVKY